MNGVGKWILNNVRLLVTLAVIIGGVVVTMTGMSYSVKANRQDIDANAACLATFKEDVSEDIGDLKLDMREVMTILKRIEDKVD